VLNTLLNASKEVEHYNLGKSALTFTYRCVFLELIGSVTLEDVEKLADYVIEVFFAKAAHYTIDLQQEVRIFTDLTAKFSHDAAVYFITSIVKTLITLLPQVTDSNVAKENVFQVLSAVLSFWQCGSAFMHDQHHKLVHDLQRVTPIHFSFPITFKIINENETNAIPCAHCNEFMNTAVTQLFDAKLIVPPAEPSTTYDKNMSKTIDMCITMYLDVTNRLANNIFQPFIVKIAFRLVKQLFASLDSWFNDAVISGTAKEVLKNWSLIQRLMAACVTAILNSPVSKESNKDEELEIITT